MPVVDLKLSHLCTLPNQPIRIVQELIEILVILGLTCDCSKRLVSHYRLFFLVLDALSDEILVGFAADLPEDEADLMLEQTCLGLVVLFGKQLRQDFDGFLALSVAHQVHDPVFVEEGNIFPKEQPQKSRLFEHFLQFSLCQVVRELLFVVGSSWFFGLKVVLAVSGFQVDVPYLLHCDFTCPSQLITGRMDVLHVQFLQLRQEIVGQCFSRLMP